MYTTSKSTSKSMTRNKIVTTLAFWLLLQCSFSLSLFDEKSYNATAYSDALMKTQKQFETKVAEVKSQIEIVGKILDNSTMTNSVKVVEASEGIADERNTLYDMQQILKIPFELRECKCAQLDQAKRAEVTAKIQSISSVIASTRQSLKKCKEDRCPRYEEIALELSQSQNYLTIMNQTINAECCRGDYKFVPETATGLVNVGNAIYKDNLAATNWFYGSTTQKEYALKRFELSTKFNLTSCPLDKPYADLLDNKCKKCSKSIQYFNLGDRQCYSCSNSNSYFNLTTGQCHPCNPNEFLNATTLKCASCPSPTAYNETSQTCEPCAKNEYPSPSSPGCAKCEVQQVYNANSKKCEGCDITHGYFLNKTTFNCDKCPAYTYYSLGSKTCINCTGGAHYNATSGKCQTCPDGTYFISAENICKSCPADTFFNQVTQKCISCPNGTVYNATQKICIKVDTPPVTTHPKCPADKPIYNSYTKTCDVCKYGYTLDAETNTCKPNNFVSICPPDRPIYNSTSLTCMACPANSDYDPVNHICKGVFCGKDEYLDTDSLSCVPFSSTCTGDEFYDPKTQKCLELSTKCNSAIETYSQAQKKCVPFNQACPKGYYFNTLSKRCISVTFLCTVNQFYSYASGQCMPLPIKCTVDEYFNQTENRCMPTSGVCTSQEYYNTSLHSCRDAAQLCSKNQVYSEKILKCVSIASTCNVDQFYSQASNKCEEKSSQCTADQIYIRDTHVCVNRELYCSKSQFYSTASHSCVEGNTICYVNQYYDKPTNSCKPIANLCKLNSTVYSLQENKCIASCPTGFTLNAAANLCERITTTTTINTTVVVKQCKPDETYVADVNICVKTFTQCTEAQFYNSVSYKCESPTYITSPFAPNLLMQNRQFSEYETYYKSKVDEFASTPDAIRDCLPDKPYYDTLARGCIACPATSSIFNLETSKCSKCGSDYTYNPAQHKCLPKQTAHHFLQASARNYI